MSRRVHEAVRVWLPETGRRPTGFLWGDRYYGVEQVVLAWKECRAWWDGQGERTCFRVRAAARDQPAGHFDLVYDHEGRGWLLTRVWD